jgi:type IV secretion system protein VirB9
MSLTTLGLFLLATLPAELSTPAPPMDARPASSDPAFRLLDPEELAFTAFRTQGKAPVLQSPGLRRYPYGLPPSPFLNCLPDTLCTIDLEPGEEIRDVALGHESWAAEQALSGAGGADTYHVLLRPLPEATDTNLIITTSRRLYSILVTSNPTEPATPRIGFYYPQDLLRIHNERALQSAREVLAAPTTGINADRLHFGYRIGRSPIAPDFVFDDGDHTYLVWNERPKAAPIVFAKSGKDAALLNFHPSPDGRRYTIDGIHHHLELKLDRHTASIKRTN